MINYFNFKKLVDGYLITNDLGKYMFVNEEEFIALRTDSVDYESEFGKKAVDNFFCYPGSLKAFADQMSHIMRESKNYLFASTALHIFVVTNACNMKCVYCQAQSGNSIPNGMMTKEIAKKAVDIALSSPNQSLTFEFQGGEPLLNFDVIKYIVEYTKEQNSKKNIEFSLVSNLTLLTDEIAEFICENNIGLSTSLDGGKTVHNANRCYRAGMGTYEDVIKGIQLAREYGIYVGAIQTTTKYSLDYHKEIIDEYLNQGFNNVFIRNLTPLGCAEKSWDDIGYTPHQFVDFYKKCFDYILSVNKSGTFLKEGHATVFLSKLLTSRAVNYMELRSPCGAGIGQIAYYYDGDVFTCDEGRMLSEMGNDAFKLGNVDNSFEELIGCSNCKAACVSSFLESLPNCSDCVYNPYCGTCPVVNYALNNSVYVNGPNDYKCVVYKGILDTIIEALKNKENRDILESWIN